jgi:membrane-associated phospholipid phosphatase
MPKKMLNKILWGIFIISIGLILVTTRVGVGAHFPLDVVSGSIIGYISGLLGIFISRKYKIWAWINSKKYYPVFIVLLLVCIAIVLNRIVTMNLIVFYVTFLCLIVSLYKIIYVYVKK